MDGVRELERRTPIVMSEGDAFTRGRSLGRAVPARVHRTVEAYLGLCAYHAGLDRARVLDEAARFIPAIDGLAPALLEEMRGIADGAGCDPREIVAINARTELLHGAARRPECTAVAVAPPASADGHVRIAQNWDWFAALAGTTVLWALRRDDGPDVLTFTEAGIVGKIGVNAAGLGLCVNLLMSDADHPGPAAPMHVILRHVLDTARSVDAAVALIAATPRSTSCNHLLADRAGALADVEAMPHGCRVARPAAGTLAHANHCADDDLVAGDRGARDYPETAARGARGAGCGADARSTDRREGGARDPIRPRDRAGVDLPARGPRPTGRGTGGERRVDHLRPYGGHARPRRRAAVPVDLPPRRDRRLPAPSAGPATLNGSAGLRLGAIATRAKSFAIRGAVPGQGRRHLNPRTRRE